MNRIEEEESHSPPEKVYDKYQLQKAMTYMFNLTEVYELIKFAELLYIKLEHLKLEVKVNLFL